MPNSRALDGITVNTPFREMMSKLMEYLGISDEKLWGRDACGHHADAGKGIMPFPRTVRDAVENGAKMQEQLNHDPAPYAPPIPVAMSVTPRKGSVPPIIQGIPVPRGKLHAFFQELQTEFCQSNYLKHKYFQ